MTEPNEREPRGDNVIDMDDYIARKSSRAKRQRAEERAADEARLRVAEAKAEADPSTEALNIPVDDHDEAYRAQVASLDDRHISVTLGDDTANTFLEDIAIPRLIGSTMDYMAEVFYAKVVVGQDGFPIEERKLTDRREDETVEQRTTATAYILVHATMVDTEEDFSDLAETIDRAILADRAIQRCGAPVPFAGTPDLVRIFPGIGRAVRRGREEATYELYGGAGHVCKMDAFELDEMRIQLFEQVLAYAEPFNEALEADKGTKNGEPRFRLLADLASDGMVAQAPVTQDGSRYRRLTNLAKRGSLSRRERRLLERLRLLQATGMNLGKGFAVGWNMHTMSLPEMHLIPWVNLVAAGIPEKWWEIVDFTDDGEAKGKTERDGILEFLEFMARYFPEYTPERVWTDMAGSVVAFHEELHDRFGCQVVSPPTETQLATHFKEALPEVGVEVPSDAKYDQLKRLADEYAVRYINSLKDTDAPPMRPLRPYGRVVCPKCGIVPQTLESVDPYPDAKWRSDRGLLPGMSAAPLYKGKGAARRHRRAFKCKECGTRYRTSYTSDPLQWSSVPHVADRTDRRNTEPDAEFQPHDLLSAERDVMAGQTYSRRECVNSTMRVHGFGNKGIARRQWGKTYEVQMLLLHLVAICSNARQLVHATGAYQQVLAEELAGTEVSKAA